MDVAHLLPGDEHYGLPAEAAEHPINWMMTALAGGMVLSMGHRGASEVPGIPEFSLQSFEFSASRGYPLLEISTNRTADGQWICSHDHTLKRTSQDDSVPPIAAMTWAQVQQLRHHENCAGEPTPYRLVEDIVARFATTHIFAIDPKSSWRETDSLLDLCDQFGGATRFMGKWVGTDPEISTTLSEAFHARGYLLGGYWYETDFRDGLIQAVEGLYDLSGMDFRASADVWEYLVSLKKPVIGHILNSEDAARTAIAHGASILQTARPDLCPARSWWTDAMGAILA